MEPLGRTIHRSALTFLVALFAAAVCLVMPGLAQADSVTDTTPEATTDPVDNTADPLASYEGTAYALGGIQITLPDGFDVVDLGSMMIASNADASIVVSIMPSGTNANVPTSPDEWQAFFTPLAQATAEDTGATLSDGGIYTLADLSQSYLFLLEFAENGTTVQAAQCYVPLGDGSFALVQITIDAADAEAAELGDGISATLVRATENAVQLGSPPKAMMPLADNSATGILTLAPMGSAAEADATATAAFNGIERAERAKGWAENCKRFAPP